MFIVNCWNLSWLYRLKKYPITDLIPASSTVHKVKNSKKNAVFIYQTINLSVE